MVKTVIKDIELIFETAAGLFSPKEVDRGTLALLSVINFDETDKVCDLGCGYGVVGIVAAKAVGSENVLMIDHDELAVALARKNVVLNAVDQVEVVLSDGFSSVYETGFSKIISHPPYHADFSVPKHFIEKGFNRLKIEGALYMVTKRRTWYENKLKAIFGKVAVFEIDGYYVFKAVKTNVHYANAVKKEKIKTPPKAKRRRNKF